MSTLRLYNYNNYFNRIVKKESSLANYGTPLYVVEKTNFDMNDSVETSHVVNYNGFDGDYVIITDDKDNITSRWFVMENQRTRGGQHKLQLRRDLIVDNYDKVINAPMLVNRAMISDKANPLLFNSEGFSFNEIKKEEKILEGKTKTRWAVLYFKKGMGAVSGSFNVNKVKADITISSPISSSPIYSSGTKQILKNTKFNITGAVDYSWWLSTQKYIRFFIDENGTSYNKFWTNKMNKYLFIDQDYDVVISQFESVYGASGVYSALYSRLQTELSFNNTITETQASSLEDLVNTTITVKDSDNKIYSVKVIKTETQVSSPTATDPDSTLTTYFKNLFDSTTLTKTGAYGDSAFAYDTTKVSYEVITTEITSNAINWSIDFGSYVYTTEGNYDILAIPYDDVSVIGLDYTASYRDIPSINSRLLINSISLAPGVGSNLVDIQLLPYCPLENELDPIGYSGYNISMYRVYNNPVYQDFSTTITIGDDTYDVLQALIIYVQNQSFSSGIRYNATIDIENITENEAINYKVNNECCKYRLVSPNYNGNFEFSVAKNYGLSGCRFDITLRPFNPYIRVYPAFKGLYGNEFGDSRGLICGGDFSLPRYSSEWVEYELRNRNYQIAFDRQISHMEYEYSRQRQEAVFGAITGSIGAGISGGVAGGFATGGNPAGALTGAVIGTVSSAIGGAMDVALMKERQAENKDFVIDNFKYQLGNIKALPYNINKVSPITINNKKYPFIEVYSATDLEKNILVNKITYNSMVVNAIGTISEYLQSTKTFISGSLIRLEDLNMQMHEASEIYDEIMKGVYI